ncbi:MAG: amidohydrolase [Pseudomonadota bacterium]
MNRRFLALPLIVLALTACADKPPVADAVYLNARIYTANPDLPWAEAMVVRDEKLTYVGDNDTASGYRAMEKIDLDGRLVLPGLIDAHVHPGFIAMYADLLPLPEAEDRESQMRDIARLIADNPDKDLIFAIGWNNEFFGTTGPHRRDLDALESSRPVLIFDITMHSLWANTRALELSGIGEDPVDPWPGVAFFQRDENGDLTGYVTESAAFSLAGSLTEVREQEEQVLREFLSDLKKDGITAVFDAGNFGRDDEVYGAVTRMDERGELPVRYYGSYSIMLPAQYDTAVEELKRMHESYRSENVRVDTLKVFYDGVVETRGAHLLKDYSDMPGHRGASLFGVDNLKQLILDLDRENLHLHIHTIGDQAARSALDAVELAQTELDRQVRSRITLTHLQVVDEADYARFAELGVIAQFTPAWHGHDHGYYYPALGGRADTPYPVQPILEAGAKVSFSSDVYFPSEWHDGSASPFTGIQVGHTRQYREDAPHGPTGLESEKLGIDVLIDGYTRGAAWQLGQEGVQGMLKAGYLADFIVLDTDLFTMPAHTISELEPSAVFIGGQLVQGSLQPRDWHAMLSRRER